MDPGRHADVLVVDGDPLQDTIALWLVVDVFRSTEQVDRGISSSPAIGILQKDGAPDKSRRPFGVSLVVSDG